MAQVEFSSVRKVYPGGVVAVDDATLSVSDGELVVLVGPSGCGKSTTLRLLAGLESITEGTIQIDGRQVNDVSPKDRDIAMVFQNYALYPHMTVYDNVAFGLKLRKYPKEEIRQRVGQAAEILGIKDILHRKPKQLSGGQQQRVAVGRAIVRKPKVFLFDEPLSNLDAKLRVQMRAEIARLHRSLGATMIYVTHDQVEAMTLGDRIVVMHEGVIQQMDTPLRLYNLPANAFVASFIGNPPMNLVRGSVRRQEGAVFVSDSGELTLPLEAGDRQLDSSLLDHLVILGIRPEDIYMASNRHLPSFTSEIDASLVLTEPVGNEMFVHVRTGDDQLVARVAPQEASEPGQQINLAVDIGKIHLFDAISTASLHSSDSN